MSLYWLYSLLNCFIIKISYKSIIRYEIKKEHYDILILPEGILRYFYIDLYISLDSYISRFLMISIGLHIAKHSTENSNFIVECLTIDGYRLPLSFLYL